MIPPTNPRTESSPGFYQPKIGPECYAPRYWFTWLVLLLLRIGALLPLVVLRWFGAVFGLLMMAANTKRRRIAAINIKLCFPELTERQRRKIRRRHFMVMGQSYVDLGFLAWGSRRRIRSKVRFRGLEHYRALVSQGRNIILLLPHCVGLNFGGAVLAAEHPFFTMAKIQRNPIANWLLSLGRTRFGVRLLVRDQGLRPVVRNLKHGLVFCYLPDEDLGTRASVFAPFFGVPAATLSTLGRLARMTDAAVVPCFTRLLPSGQGYEVILKPAISDFPSGDRVADAAHMNRVIERGIREMPEQYMWTLRLFKTRPENAPSPYD